MTLERATVQAHEEHLEDGSAKALQTLIGEYEKRNWIGISKCWKHKFLHGCEPPRPLEAIQADIVVLEKEIGALLKEVTA